MNPLFVSQPINLDLPNSEIIYYTRFFDNKEADVIFKKLIHEIPWQQDEIKVFGKIHPQPRLTALFGDEGIGYSYSSIKMESHPWNQTLQKIKKQVEELTQSNFNIVLLNYYRDGKDSNGWHADNEKELGTNPVIASLSFGCERSFQLKHNSVKNLKKNIVLEHGSLLLMQGTTQHFWKHQIPKTAKPIGARLNLTFRFIK
jgi:alkylated DNA repair dioxygenase AlkB